MKIMILDTCVHIYICYGEARPPPPVVLWGGVGRPAATPPPVGWGCPPLPPPVVLWCGVVEMHCRSNVS